MQLRGFEAAAAIDSRDGAASKMMTIINHDSAALRMLQGTWRADVRGGRGGECNADDSVTEVDLGLLQSRWPRGQESVMLMDV
eukprot:scaffold274_cov144-Skeletonema_menzelii.AAC.19